MGEERPSTQRTLTPEEEEAAWGTMGPVDGMYLPPSPPGMQGWEDKIADLRGMKLRDDDVLLLTYPKSGIV